MPGAATAAAHRAVIVAAEARAAIAAEAARAVLAAAIAPALHTVAAAVDGLPQAQPGISVPQKPASKAGCGSSLCLWLGLPRWLTRCRDRGIDRDKVPPRRRFSRGLSSSDTIGCPCRAGGSKDHFEFEIGMMFHQNASLGANSPAAGFLPRANPGPARRCSAGRHSPAHQSRTQAGSRHRD